MTGWGDDRNPAIPGVVDSRFRGNDGGGGMAAAQPFPDGPAIQTAVFPRSRLFPPAVDFRFRGNSGLGGGWPGCGNGGLGGGMAGLREWRIGRGDGRGATIPGRSGHLDGCLSQSPDIPALTRHSRESGNPGAWGCRRRNHPRPPRPFRRLPFPGGGYSRQKWIPAFAGMAGAGDARGATIPSRPGYSDGCLSPEPAIPANGGFPLLREWRIGRGMAGLREWRIGWGMAGLREWWIGRGANRPR